MHNPNPLLSLSQTLQATLAAHAALRAFTLIDGAVLQAALPDRCAAWLERPGVTLLAGADPDVIPAGPLLLELSKADIEAELAEQLLDRPTGQMAASFIAAPMTRDALAARLAPLTEVRLADRTPMVMRFFDPRVLPFWLKMLREDYQNHLAASLHAWIYWDDKFEVRTHRFPVPEQTPVEKPRDAQWPMALSEHEEDRLLTACYPHTLIQRFRSERPAALEKVAPENRYAFFKQQIDQCQKHGIEGEVTIETYCMLAIDLGPCFDLHPLMAPVLKAAQEGQPMKKALAALSPAQWQQIKEMRS